jgi:hypothetical protein
VAGLAGQDLSARLSARLSAAGEAKAAIAALCQAHQGREEETFIDGPGGHRFSIGPSRQALYRLAGAVAPALFSPEGGCLASVWKGFGEAVAARCWVMEDRDAAQEALLSYLGSLADEVLEGATLASIYRRAGLPFEVTTWAAWSVPRVGLGGGVEPTHELRAASVPEDLDEDQAKQLSGFRLQRAGEPGRILLVQACHGLTGEDLLRSEPGSLAQVLADAASVASTPQAELAVSGWAASSLNTVPPGRRSVDGTGTAMAPGGPVHLDGKDVPEGTTAGQP